MEAAIVDTGDLLSWLADRPLRSGVDGGSTGDGEGARESDSRASTSELVKSFAYSGRIEFSSDSKERSMVSRI